MKLFKYKSKRNLKVSNEPKALLKKKKSSTLAFVIQKHHATHLHYDLRLEAEGVLKSWAIPKEPSSDPSVKRLAILVEDHPYSYKDFEGTIPSGYGAGTVRIWDRGFYEVDQLNARESEKKILKGLKKGSFHFTLHGRKLKGVFHMVRLKSNQWLLIKKQEEQNSSYRFTHLDKLYWPKEKITKGDLLEYYSSIARFILPHLKDRPESLRRYPNGVEGSSFFQKNLSEHPDFIKTFPLKQTGKVVHYLLIQDENSLLYAANLGCIELHPFFSRIGSLDKPDYVVFDLDPKGAPFSQVVEVAQHIHKLLDAIGVLSYPKTSGASGLHITIPLGARYSYSQAKEFAEIISMRVCKELPSITTLERSLNKRQGKIYIDYHQNNLGQTIAAPYCVRAKPYATVSTPLLWREVNQRLKPQNYTIKNLPARLKKMGDLYAPVLGKGIDLKKALKNLKETDNNYTKF